jgi:hypothetical protein
MKATRFQWTKKTPSTPSGRLENLPEGDRQKVMRLLDHAARVWRESRDIWSKLPSARS